MRGRLVSLNELSKRDLEAWSELAGRALEPNPFFEPGYVLPLARGLGQQGAVRLAVAEDRDGWQGCLPIATGRWHRIPLPAVAGWRGHKLYGLLGTPLVGREHSGTALAGLIATTLNGQRSCFGALEWVASDGPVAAALDEVLAARERFPIRFERFERAMLRRRVRPDYLEQTLSSKHRRELRRQRRKLGEELQSDPSTVDRAGEAAAVDELISLEAAAKGARGTVLAAAAGHVSFFREMCRNFAAQGRLQLLSFGTPERPLAMKCNLRAGDGLFMLKIAYDEQFAGFSPGIQLEVDMVGLFHEASDAGFMDSCADPNNAMINRLWADRRPLVTHVLRRAGAADRLTTPMVLAARSLRERNSRRKAHDTVA